MKISIRTLACMAMLIVGRADAGKQEDLFKAAGQCDLKGVTDALAGGASVSATDALGHIPLAKAFFCADVTKLLLDKGSDVNGGTYPALINAANNYSVEVVRLLLDAGADPNKIGTSDPARTFQALIAGERAKGSAANQGLINAWQGAANQLKGKITTASALAVTVMQTNCVACLDMLLKKGAKLESADSTIMHTFAGYAMSREERKKAFAAGKGTLATFGIKAPDWYGNLPDDRNGTPEQMLALLVAAGFDLNAPQKDGHTPLTVATPVKPHIAKALVRAGADPKIVATWKHPKGAQRYFPICQAAENGDVELVKLMLDAGADIDSSGSSGALLHYPGAYGGDGFTPLSIALLSGKLDIAHMLLDRGASVQIGANGFSILKAAMGIDCMVTLAMKTPIFWAIETGNQAIVEKIAAKMSWAYEPKFMITVIAGGGAGYKCITGNTRYSPSRYAGEIGQNGLRAFLAGKGL